MTLLKGPSPDTEADGAECFPKTDSEAGETVGFRLSRHQRNIVLCSGRS